MTGEGADRWAVERAILASDFPAPSRLLLFVLLTHVTKGTLVIPSKYAPSLTVLTNESGLSRAGVALHLKTLETEGWLERFRPPVSKARAEHAKTGYRIAIPMAAPEEASPHGGLVQEMDQPPTSPGDGPAGQEGLFGDSPGDGLVQDVDQASPGRGPKPNVGPTSSSPSEKKGSAGGKSRRSADDEHPRFAEWYAAYPKKHDPGDARRAFNRAVKKVSDPQILIDGARRYAREQANTEKRFIKAPAVWLNKESWLNEPQEPLRATGTDGASARRAAGIGALADLNFDYDAMEDE